MEFTIREMQPEDWPEVVEIYRQGVETGIATFQTEIPTYETWNHIHRPNCRFVAVTQEDTVAGWIALAPTSTWPVYAGVCEISIYIHRDYRGNSLGERLMLYTIDRSERAGVWCLYSAIFEINLASRHLHDKCGFREIGYREKIAKDVSGIWRNTVLYERRSNLVELGGDGEER